MTKDSTKSSAPKRISIFEDGDESWILDVSPEGAEVSISTSYVRADIADEMLAALKAVVAIYGDKLSPDRLREIKVIIAKAEEKP